MILRDIYNENIVVEDKLDLYGIINGDVIIQPNCTFVLHGIMNGNIVMQEDSHCNIYGILRGNVTGDTHFLYVDNNAVISH